MSGAREDVATLNDFRAQWEAISERALAAVDRVGRSGWLVMGDELRAFESALAHLFEVPHAVGCGSGLDAIEIALRTSDLPLGSAVLTTPLSAFATTLAILRAGLVPRFVDVDGSGLMDLDAARAALDSDPGVRAMVPVHLFGHSMNLEQLAAIEERGVLVVEDCAQAVGARWKGRSVGTAGSMGALSLYPTKNLGALGDGGAVLTRDADRAALARMLRDYGQTEKYLHEHLGQNSRLDEIQAAILRDAMLPDLARNTERRRAIASRYLAEIRNPRISLPVVSTNSESVWHLFPLLVDEERDAFREHMGAHGVETGVHYPTLITDQPALARAGHQPESRAFPVAQRFARCEVSLPVHPYLTTAAQRRVIDACNSW